MKHRRLCWVWSVALSLFVGCYDSAPEPEVASSVDLERFQGKWYEIAKLPRLTQTNCTGTVATYRLRPDGDLEMKSECHVDSLEGPPKVISAKAIVPDRTVAAKLALQIAGFYGDYWILEVGDSYEYAVVGHPSREYLWILSRTPSLDQTTLSAALKRAKAQHYNVDRLEYTVQ
jgi:apolipoprotein D and lipocalin family protein